MTDRELLELAAKAVGIELEGDLHGNPGEWVPMYYEGKTYHPWDPLTDDGDAFRMASALLMTVEFGNNSVLYPTEGFGEGTDPLKAARHAIVLAAAELGRALP